jgi:hypothetical protein
MMAVIVSLLAAGSAGVARKGRIQLEVALNFLARAKFWIPLQKKKEKLQPQTVGFCHNFYCSKLIIIDQQQ